MSFSSLPPTPALNEQQHAIVTATEPAILILAGPGSGKTKTLLHRIAYLITERKIPAHQIVALAFNRVVAQELAQRLFALIGPRAHGVRCLTFHGCALAITGSAGESINWDNDDVYDDLLIDATVRLQTDRHLPAWCETLHTIVCDEFQDVDLLLADFVDALATAGRPSEQPRHLIIAGDDDQAIYGFKGGEVVYLSRFVEQYHAKTYVLTANYRCTQPIIQAANTLIAHIPDRFKQATEAQGHIDAARQDLPAAPVSVVTFAGGILAPRSRLATAAAMHWLADRIMGWITKQGIAPTDIAILTREWDHLKRLEQELRFRQILMTRVRTHDQIERASALTKTLPAYRWMQDLHRLRKRPVRERAETLLDQMCAKWGHHPTEPSVIALRRIAMAIDQDRSDKNHALLPTTGADILAALHEDRLNDVIDEGTGVILSSLHGQKGREFRKVAIILRDDALWDDDERRLMYVGMTRAREELILLAETDHEALEEIGSPVTYDIPIPTEPTGPLFYHAECGPHEVHLGHEATAREQDRIQTLREGDPLLLVPGTRGRWAITTPDGVMLGELSKDQTHELTWHRITQHNFQFAVGEVTVYQIRHFFVDKTWRWVVMPAIQVARPQEIDTTDIANDLLKVYE
jgi:ATP-dependent DNA helicase RecQ